MQNKANHLIYLNFVSAFSLLRGDVGRVHLCGKLILSVILLIHSSSNLRWYFFNNVATYSKKPKNFLFYLADKVFLTKFSSLFTHHCLILSWGTICYIILCSFVTSRLRNSDKSIQFVWKRSTSSVNVFTFIIFLK